MPRRKKTSSVKRRVPQAKIIEHPTPRQGITAYARDSYKWAESYTSLLMGVVVVIVAVLFVVSLIRATHHVQDTSSVATGPTSTTTSITPTPQPAQPTAGHTYTVVAGDDLWHIAEKVYGNGDNWVDIAQANNLADPSTIFTGNQLVLPQITPAQTQATSSINPISQTITQQDTEAISADTYTVMSGDTLWDIAVRAYADGYKWTEIAQANNLANPGLIFSGNVLTIPR